MADMNLIKMLAAAAQPDPMMSKMDGSQPYLPSKTNASIALDTPPGMQLKSLKVPVGGGTPNVSYAKQFDDQFRDTMAARGVDLQALKAKLAETEAAKPQGLEALNLRPFLSLADNLNGTKNEFNYNQPDVINQWQGKVDKLRDAVSKGANGLSDDQLGYLKEKAAEEKSRAMMAQYGAMADFRNKKLDLMDDGLALRAGNKIDTNSLIQASQTQNQNLNKALETLSGTGKLTPQMLSEIENDLAAALNGKGAATDHVRKNVEMDAWKRNLANIKQLTTGVPQDVGVDMHEYKEYLGQTIQRLREANELNIAEKAKSLQAGYSHLSSAKTKAVVDDKVKSLSGGGDSSAVGKVKVSNGQEIREIDAADLSHAVTDGWKQVK